MYRQNPFDRQYDDKMPLKRIGIAGCGAIGSQIAKAILQDFASVARLRALYDIDPLKARGLSKKLGKRHLTVPNLKALIDKSDIVVECASAQASAQIARLAIEARRDCMLMSVGGLLEEEEILELARRAGVRLYIPSGAICGIDGLKAHSLAGLRKVLITTRKPATALKNAPYVIDNKIDLSRIKKETLLFSGKAKDAVKAFPQNINVAAVLSLAGMGKNKTMVRIIASPNANINSHEIEIESKAGKAFVRCENIPSPDNPKTSYLAVLSAISALKQIFESVRIGT